MSGPMTAKAHAHHARRLIAACDGLEDAAAACRASVSSLSRYQIAGSGQFMPADVIADLEAYCGQPLYSAALAEARPASVGAKDLMQEGCEAAESASDLQRHIRQALSDGELSPREKGELAKLVAAAKAELADVEALLLGEGSGDGR